MVLYKRKILLVRVVAFFLKCLKYDETEVLFWVKRNQQFVLKVF